MKKTPSGLGIPLTALGWGSRWDKTRTPEREAWPPLSGARVRDTHSEPGNMQAASLFDREPDPTDGAGAGPLIKPRAGSRR